MAELEVAKHTKKVYKLWRQSNRPLAHKIQETALEIGIIVFAITLSLWLHNWSEHRHQVQEATEFLAGLKTDLTRDLDELRSDKQAYENLADGLRYFRGVMYGAALQKDSLQKYRKYLYNATQLNANSSRFDGLKASGKIDIIENKDLQNAILELYQEDIPLVEYLNENFNSYKKQRLEPFLDQHLDLDAQGNGNWEQVLRLPEMRNQMMRAGGIDQIINQYQKIIDKNKAIIALIDKER